VGALLIQRLEGSRFVRGGYYGISIDLGLQVVGKKSGCATILKSKLIDIGMKPGSMIASS
jgi:hypothetical protein